MMTVADKTQYQRHRETRTGRSWAHLACFELGLPMLLFGSMGAITWAIRGTGGWGGIDGTIVPGMTWGLLWYYLCYRKGIDARGISLWLGLGIAIGGELGYGQYVSWIQGMFNVGDEVIPIAPRIGYAWFVISGIGWGAPGGIALGWALSGRAPLDRWLVRILVPGAIGFLGWLFVQQCPWLFFPHHGLGLYVGKLEGELLRTVYTNTQNFTVVAWWAGAMLVAWGQRDRATLAAGALIGGGFGIGFTLGALWCLGYTYAPGYVDWWKVWELSAGFNLGLLYVVALYWATRQTDKAHHPDGALREALPEQAPSPNARDRRRNIILTLCAFFLVFVLFHGASYRIGALLGLYEEGVNQYAWPPGRVVLFAPVAVVIISVTAISLVRMLRQSRLPAWRRFAAPHLPERMADLMTVIGVVGAATIWPAKISVLYALFLCLALFAFNRLNRHFRGADTPAPRQKT